MALRQCEKLLFNLHNTQRSSSLLPVSAASVSDPYSFDADPDPAFILLKTDPDPAPMTKNLKNLQLKNNLI
jgi:hypothetical protein